MELDMSVFNRLCEITGGTYSASKNDDETKVTLYDTQDALEDVITEFGVLQENYTDMREKIQKALEDIQERKFLIDMVDRWTDSDNKAWEHLTDMEMLLKSFLENDRE